MDLESQFRCNGSDGYLAWLARVLQVRESASELKQWQDDKANTAFRLDFVNAAN